MQGADRSGMEMANFLLNQTHNTMKQIMMVLVLVTGFSLAVAAQPPHAKAHGKHKHRSAYKGGVGHQFYYYPEYNVYYHPAGKKYARVKGGRWVWVNTPPPAFVLRSTVRHEFFYDDFDVWGYEPVRRYRRPSVQVQLNF